MFALSVTDKIECFDHNERFFENPKSFSRFWKCSLNCGVVYDIKKYMKKVVIHSVDFLSVRALD
jgi:hypothetical protein